MLAVPSSETLMTKHLPLLILALALAWGCGSKKSENSGEASASKSGAQSESVPPQRSANLQGKIDDGAGKSNVGAGKSNVVSGTKKEGAATAKTVTPPAAAQKEGTNPKGSDGTPDQAAMEAAIAAARAQIAAKQAAPVEVDPNVQTAAPADAKKTASGLAYKVLKAGTGKVNPKSTEHVTVHYTGWSTDGKVFDSSVKRGKPASFPLNGVIKGWTEGLQLMVEGEKTRFWIPAGLAYGENPGGGKPGGLLIFDVELIEIVG